MATANRKSRRAQKSTKQRSKRTSASSTKPNGSSDRLELSAKQRERIRAIYDQLESMEVEHSRMIRRNRAAEQAVEQQIDSFSQKMQSTASSMIESLGLSTTDPEVQYHLDPTTGKVSSQPRQAAPPTTDGQSDEGEEKEEKS